MGLPLSSATGMTVAPLTGASSFLLRCESEEEAMNLMELKCQHPSLAQAPISNSVFTFQDSFSLFIYLLVCAGS